MAILSTYLGQPAPASTNTDCPTPDCRLPDYTSLAVCPVCDSDAVYLGADNKNCDYYIGEPLKYEKAPDERYPLGDHDGDRSLMTVAKASNPVSFGSHLSFSDFAAAAAKSEEGSIWRKQCAVKFKSMPKINLTFEVTPQRWVPTVNQSLHNRTNYSDWLSKLPFVRKIAMYYIELVEEHILKDAVKAWTTGFEDTQAPRTEEAAVLSACGLEYYVDENHLQSTLWSNLCYVASGNAATVQSLDTFGVMNASFSGCRLSLCSRHYQNASIAIEGGIKASKITDLPFVAINATDPLGREDLQAYDDTIPINSTLRAWPW